MYTVLGAGGFIGRAVAAELERRGHVVVPVRRDDPLPAGNMGHVIDCVGLTGDFRERPVDAMEAHVGRLLPIVREGRFDSFVYLSSTRVYAGLSSGSEDVPLHVSSTSASDLYNISKLAGEALVLSQRGEKRVHVARLANVYGQGDRGSPSLLSQVIGAALTEGRVVIRTPADAAKDFVDVRDVVAALIAMSTKGRAPVYNVASGRRVTNAEIAALITRHIGAPVVFEPSGQPLTFPELEISRMTADLGVAPSQLADTFGELVQSYGNEA